MQLSDPAKTTGAISLAVGGVVATFTAESAREWLELIAQYAPLILSGWLLYILYKSEGNHDACQKELLEVHKELSALHGKITQLELRTSNDLDDGK